MIRLFSYAASSALLCTLVFSSFAPVHAAPHKTAAKSIAKPKATAPKKAVPKPSATNSVLADNGVPTYLVSETSAQTAKLAENGKALMPIVVADEASKNVATELQIYLKQITGADFKVEVGDGKSGIVVGTLAQFPDPELDKPLVVRGVRGREAFAIRTDAKRVRLIAATDKALGHVQYRFLELLGVRWFFPAKHWEVVPKKSTLTFNTDQSDRPVILSRGIWVSWGFFPNSPETPHERGYGQARSTTEYFDYMRRNLQGGSMQVNTGHAWFEIIKNNPKLWEHPEYFALVGGKRQVHWEAKLEMGNPELRQFMVDYALDYFAKNPNSDMISLDPNDGGGWSESPESAALGNVSDQLFTMINQVAKAVKAKYPGKMVGLYAYNFHSMPPKFELEDNVYIQMPTAFTQGKYDLTDLLDMWPKKAKNFGLYTYGGLWEWTQNMKWISSKGLEGTIQNYVRHNATSISAESGNDWGPSGKMYYLQTKLMWNPNADVKAIEQDFYDKAFGPAAPAMKKYYDLAETSVVENGGISRNTFGLALRHLDEAGRAAKDDAEATRRIDDIKQYLHYIHLNWEWDRVNALAPAGVSTPAKEKAWHGRWEQTYRERFSYMTHFQAQSVKGYVSYEAAAKEFPDKPFTREERDAQWQEMMDTYKPLEIHEREFSYDLLPVNFGEGGSETRQHFPNRAGFNLYSDGKQPLSFKIQTDALPGFEGRPDARYRLFDLNDTEKVVDTGRMLLDGKSHELKWNLPKGPYGLDFDGMQGSWTFIAPKGQPVTQGNLKLWPRNQQGPLQDMFFYVPKGTTQIEFAQRGRAIKIVDPNGEDAKVKAQNGDTFILEVPAGTDGKVWKAPDFALNYIWFHNIPNHLAAAPSSLLVPREVAKADGLTIRQ